MGKTNKGIKLLIAILVILIIALGIMLVSKIYKSKDAQEVVELPAQEIKKEESKKQVQIFSGDDRSIAVMIDNQSGARPQAGLNDAYMIYDIIVEGGLSRMMAVFKGKDLEKIGPVRSSRHYFLDYALENDSIYVHYGWSPKAESDISKLNVDNINGLTESSTFWRVKDKKSPHNAVTSTEKVLDRAKSFGYKTKSTAESILNYTVDEVNLETEDAIVATNVAIPYSKYYRAGFVYDETTKRYIRYEDRKEQVDWDTKEKITTKNIIITFAKNTDLNDGENKGRQDLKNIGDLDGYYITNGKAIKIICSKSSRTEKTVYKDLAGNEINVNDGNTFVQICPIDAQITFE